MKTNSLISYILDLDRSLKSQFGNQGTKDKAPLSKIQMEFVYSVLAFDCGVQL